MDNIKNEKILGYVLLAVGLLFILFSAHSVYTVFTGVNAPPRIFKMDSVVIPATANSPAVSLMSGENMSRITDMSMWYIMMFFLVNVGGKISGLGIQLVKQIKVTVKSKDGVTTIPTE